MRSAPSSAGGTEPSTRMVENPALHGVCCVLAGSSKAGGATRKNDYHEIGTSVPSLPPTRFGRLSVGMVGLWVAKPEGWD